MYFYLCIFLHIYNSVLPRRHTHLNSFGSAPLNATQIAVMKVSDVEVTKVGPELLFLIYKCCFLVIFARGRDTKRLRAELTVARSTALRDRRWRHLVCSMDILSKLPTRPRDTPTTTGRSRVIRLVLLY